MKAKPCKNPGEVILKLNRRDEPLLEASNGNARTDPFQLQRILVPMDFSVCAKKALQYALPLAKQHDATITLLYVVPRTNYAGSEDSNLDYVALEADQRASGEKRLCTLVVDEVCNDVPTSALVRTGSPAAEIIEAARTLPADLIVVSTHGRTGLKHALLGSVAEHVVRSAPCPVLVVRERERDFVAG